MKSPSFPVTVAVRRSDGSIEQVQVGTAVRDGDAFRLQLGDLMIGARAEAAPSGRALSSVPPSPPSDGGLVFPPYGRSKGQPIAGASRQDLEFYAGGCRRTLSDPGKARWHDKERALLAAIEAELVRNAEGDGGSFGGGSFGGGGGAGNGRGKAAGAWPDDDDAPPPRSDEDIPF